MEKIEKIFGSVVKIVSVAAIVTLALGFLIWNVYLTRLGFYEFNIFQARYIHAGLAFIIYVCLPIFLLTLFLGKFLRCMHTELIVVGVILFLLLLFYYYPIFIFPRIPQHLGGARPRVLSIIASEPEIKYLSGFDVKNIYSQVTANICVAYENQDYIVLLLENRVLILNKEDFKGFNSVPSKSRDDNANNCGKLARAWALNQAEWNLEN